MCQSGWATKIGVLVTSDWTNSLPEPDCTAYETWPGVWPGVAIDVIPGATSLPASYLVTLSPSPSSIFFTFGNCCLLMPFALAALASSVQNAHSAAGTLLSAFG